MKPGLANPLVTQIARDLAELDPDATAPGIPRPHPNNGRVQAVQRGHGTSFTWERSGDGPARDQRSVRPALPHHQPAWIGGMGAVYQVWDVELGSRLP